MLHIFLRLIKKKKKIHKSRSVLISEKIFILKDRDVQFSLLKIHTVFVRINRARGGNWSVKIYTVGATSRLMEAKTSRARTTEGRNERCLDTFLLDTTMPDAHSTRSLMTRHRLRLRHNVPWPTRQ